MNDNKPLEMNDNKPLGSLKREGVVGSPPKAIGDALRPQNVGFPTREGVIGSPRPTDAIGDALRPQTVGFPTKEISLVNQGSYGCIFRPELKCDGTIGDPHYVSKIQKDEESLINETTLGKKIAQINKYQYYFAPIENQCFVSLDKIEDSEKEKCKILQDATTAEQPIKENSNHEYVSTKIRYVSNLNIDNYLQSLPKQLYEKKWESTFYYLLNSIKKLNAQNIIHLDIKEKNIMYDKMMHNPIIIDFGISFDCTSPATSDIFYTDVYYPYWCIDIYIICNIITKNRISQTIVKEELEELIKRFFFEFFETNKKFIVPVKEEEKAPLIENHNKFFSSFIGKTYKELVDHLYKPEYYLSWDLYSLCITYLFIRFMDATVISSEAEPRSQLQDDLHKIIRANPAERKALVELLNV